MRRSLHIALVVLILVAMLLGWGYRNARADPIVRQVTLHLTGLAPGTPPVRLVLLSDVHIGNAAMDAARLTRIVGQVNALSPDIVVIAGDFIAGHDPADAVPMAAALERPLSGLHARWGTVAVLGNHDHSTVPDRVRAVLRRADVTVLDHGAVTRGPLAIGGADYPHSGRDDLPAALAALARTPGAPVMVAHSPDLAPRLPPRVGLLLAGHTHCGQVVLPLIGPPHAITHMKYLCGVVRDGKRTTIVTAGLGASGVPLRYNAPPDLWLVTLVP